MSTLVIDASVAIKWFLPELYSINAIRLLDAGYELAAPDLIFPECGNVLWKAVRTRRCSKPDAEKGLATLKAYNFITIASVALIEQAFAIAFAFDHSVYDSLYVASAVEYGVELITADQKLFNSLAGHFPIKWLGAL